MVVVVPVVYAETFEEYKERTRKEQEERDKPKETNEIDNKIKSDSSGNGCAGCASTGSLPSTHGSSSSCQAPSCETPSPDETSCILSEGGSYIDLSVHGAYLFGQNYDIFCVSGLAIKVGLLLN